ncbi:MAG: hypothetical protein Q8P46_09335 [Hyphomicrobiales bacterium]|nr:hypothetical protein [Hyphomicrobiales bacterium]
MTLTLSTMLVERTDGNPILVVKGRRGTFHAPWDAARATSALRTRLPADQLTYDIVVMDGEPGEHPRVYGASPEATAYVRTVLPDLTNGPWDEKKVDF